MSKSSVCPKKSAKKSDTTDRNGVAMEFYIGYSAMGPCDVDYAASQVGKVVALAKAALNIHAQQKPPPN